MKGLSYTLVLEEPVLANSLAGDANSARSLPYVPGGLIRGALVNAYVGKKEAGNDDFQRLFLNGNVRYLHAYPQRDGVRALPVPLAWKTFKHNDENIVFNFAKKVSEKDQLKSLPFDFYWQEKDKVILFEGEWQINVHTQRDAVRGRATAEAGAVYRYEALPAGTSLQGIILVEEESDLKDVRKLLDDSNILLGKARTAGYGQARIEGVRELEADWQEAAHGEKVTGKVTRFTLTFLSDALLRDKNGQYTLDPLPVLESLLGDVQLESKRVFRRAELVGGFNRSWGLPLPQSTAIAAGSVFVIDCKADLDASALLELEKTSLGERTAEGFGRFAISIEQSETMVWKKAFAVHAPLPEPQGLSAEETKLGEMMLGRLLRRELDQKMMSAALEAVNGYSANVPNSQLSRWQVIIRSAISQTGEPEEKVKRLREFYDKESKRNSAAWQKMERARVHIQKDKHRLSEWLNQLLENSREVWSMLGYKKAPEKKIGALALQADRALEVEYALRLMDAVLTSLSKKNKEGGANG